MTFAAKNVTLEDGVLQAITMTTGKREAAFLGAVGPSSTTEQDAMDLVAGYVRLSARIYESANLQTS